MYDRRVYTLEERDIYSTFIRQEAANQCSVWAGTLGNAVPFPLLDMGTSFRFPNVLNGNERSPIKGLLGVEIKCKIEISLIRFSSEFQIKVHLL